MDGGVRVGVAPTAAPLVHPHCEQGSEILHFVVCNINMYRLRILHV